MTGRFSGRLLTAVLGLFFALVCQSAMAALVVGEGSSVKGEEEGLLQPLASQVLACAEISEPLPGEESSELARKRPTCRTPQGALVETGGTGSTSSTWSGGGNGVGNPVLAGSFQNLPPVLLATGLPREPRTILPMGPPFELLRPPRTTA